METHRDVARRLVRQLGALPTVDASLIRLTADRLRSAKIDPKPLLLRAGLTQEQISDPDNRIAMQSQVTFLNVAAEALDDDTLGLTLATELDCRNVGLLYYVLASSDTLGTALERASRYSRITNEALALEYRKGREPAQRLSYTGVPRHTARHQIEFVVVAAIRIYRLLTGRQFVPTRVSMVHPRSKGAAAFARILGTEIAFGSKVDEIVFPPGAAEFPLVDGDPRLNKILCKVCEESLNTRKHNVSAARTLVENTITPLLPHGTPRAEGVAKALGMSERTLARRLAEEGTTFLEILQQLKATLARHYLEEESIPIAKVAWLLGFEEASSFSHACKRWTGKTPRELRSAEAEFA
jgi:AraC-like DNA-binding protein